MVGTLMLVARQEARLLLADRTLWIVSALFVAIVGYGLFKAEVIGNAGLLIYAVVIGFTPIILAA